MPGPGGTFLQALSSGVGQGQPNRKHDAALVQAALKLIKDSKAKPFLSGNIDGIVGGGTNGAIGRFQTEHMKNLPQSPLNLGKVLPNSATAQALEAALPPGTRLAAIPDHKVVYRAALESQLIEVEAKLNQKKKFTDPFRAALKSLNRAIFIADRLVLTIAPKGGYRSFQEQYDLPSAVTGAGPGESNHNFGNGCDFGFFQFAYLTEHGAWQSESEWLSVKLEGLGLHLPFWTRRNTYFAGRGLYPSKLPGDHVHIQAFDDKNVSMVKSLADLMSREAPNCYWSYQSGQYRANLIFADETQKWPVGSARAIWNSAATISGAELAAALEVGRVLRNQQPSGKLPPSLEESYLRFAGNTRASTKAWTASEVTAAQVTIMRQYLRDDLVAAESSYLAWKPVS